MKASSWRVVVEALSDQLDSEISVFVGFEARSSLDRNSPHRSLGKSLHADKCSLILLRQLIHVFRLRPSTFPGSRLRSCYSWVSESAGETI